MDNWGNNSDKLSYNERMKILFKIAILNGKWKNYGDNSGELSYSEKWKSEDLFKIKILNISERVYEITQTDWVIGKWNLIIQL